MSWQKTDYTKGGQFVLVNDPADICVIFRVLDLIPVRLP